MVTAGPAKAGRSTMKHVQRPDDLSRASGEESQPVRGPGLRVLLVFVPAHTVKSDIRKAEQVRFHRRETSLIE